MSKLRMGVASDHAGIDLKRVVQVELEKRGFEVEDFGTHTTASCDYPDFAHALGRAIEEGKVSQGVLVCGTGVGMSIAANRHAGVRAVVCSEPLSARMARRHNDANVLCIGARVVGSDTAIDILEAFVGSDFEGGRHAGRVAENQLVRQVRLPSFVEQEQRFRLRFTCEHCTYFHVERERCMHGYPNAEHREGRSADGAPEGEAPLVFCKEFELV